MSETSEKWLLGQLYPELADEITREFGCGAHAVILKPSDGSDGFPDAIRCIAFMAYHSGKLDAARTLWEKINDLEPRPNDHRVGYCVANNDALEAISMFLKGLGVLDGYLPKQYSEIE